MEPQLDRFKRSFVRISTEVGIPVGAGFLVSNDSVLTCAHVVAAALGDETTEAQAETPQETIHLNFEFLEGHPERTASVACWQPLAGSISNPSGDIAVLRLNEAVPDNAEAIRLSSTNELFGHRFRAHGFPADLDGTGVWAYGVLLDALGNGWLQIEGSQEQGRRIEQGFSGGPVEDQETGRAVGMVVASTRDKSEKVGFVIPAEVLARTWPNIVVEEITENGQQSSSGVHASPRRWERLLEPWDFTAFLAERRRGFTGRTWLFDELQDRLSHTTGPAILLTGSPGVGKSAFIASLLHEDPAGRVLAYHCCQATNPATLSPAVFVRSIAAMIAARNMTYAEMLEHPDTLAALDEAKVAADPASAFESVVLNLLQKLPSPEPAPRLLVIDALDEALAWSGSPNLLDLLSMRLGALPTWFKIVATTRDESSVKRRFRTADLLSLDAAKKDNADDLRAYVFARLDADTLRARVDARRTEMGDKVLARANGNFLVAVQTLDALEFGLFEADDLDALAPGLEPLYQEFFDRLYGRTGLDFAPARKLLQVIIAAQEPPSRDELAAVTGLDAETDLPPMLSRLASLVPPRDGRYSPFHQTLAEWLTDWNEEEDQPVAGEYYISRKQGHRLWADALLPRYVKGPTAWDVALRRYLPTHLVSAERWDDLSEVLLDLRFLEAKARGPGTTVIGLLADFDLALLSLPEVQDKRRLVFLVSEMLRLDAAFLAGYPESLFQCLWNRGYWHDNANAKAFLATPAGAQAPWDRTDPKLSALVERWRAEKEEMSPGFPWLRALRPLPEALGTAQRGVIRADSDGFDTVAVSPDGTRIVASLPESGPIGIWDAHSYAQLAFTDLTEDISVHCVRFFAAGPRIGLVAAVTWDGRLILLDEALQTVAEVQASDDNLVRVAVSPDGTLIATGDWKGVVALWEADTLTCRQGWQAHAGQVAALEFSPCGRFLASGEQQYGNQGNWVRVWTTHAAEELQLAEAKAQHWVESICFASDSELLYWGDYEGAIERWTWREDKRVLIRDVHNSPANVVRLLDERRLLCGVGGAFDPVSIEVWDVAEGRIEQYLHGHLFGVGDIALVPGTQRFVSAGDSTLRIWDLDVPSETPLEQVEPEVSWVAFREPQGWVITAAETSESVWVRTLADGRLVWRLDGHAGSVSAIALSDDLLACGANDGSVHLWDLDSGKRLWHRRHHEGRVIALAFSPQEDMLATGGEDGRVCLIAGDSGTLVDMVHQDGWIKTLAFSQDGRLVASGGFDAVRVWEAQSRKVVLELTRADGISTYYALWFVAHDNVLLLEGPGEQAMGWTIATRERVPVDDDLQAVYDAAKLRAGRRWQWDTSKDERKNQMSLVLVDTQSGAAIARFPEVQGGVQWHPDGRIWANRRSRQISLLRLDGPPES